MNLNEIALIAQELTAFVWVGLIWTIQLVSYPGFLHLPADQFPAAHKDHAWRITLIVAPLFLLEISATLLWLLVLPETRTPWHLAVMGCVATAWLSTFLIQVPLHHRLSVEPKHADMRTLIATNWIRTVAWTAKAGLMVGLALTS